jgi:hypothetical protein
MPFNNGFVFQYYDGWHVSAFILQQGYNAALSGLQKQDDEKMQKDIFYEAFNVQPGDKIFLPEKERLKIW